MRTGVKQILDRLRHVPMVFSSKERSNGELKPYRRRLQRYIQGSGIEIGALHNPMPVDRRRARVLYVDRMSLEEQRRHYPELGGYSLFEPDIVADADELGMIESGSQDFVIANHLLEHLPDPIGAFTEWYRVLRPSGILFLALPDKRFTFDKDRPRTTLAHLVADHKDRGAASRLAHYHEYSRLVHKKSGDELSRDVDRLLAQNYSIHFHVWVPDDIAELIVYLQDARALPWRVLEQIDNTGSDEFIYVLQKPA
jgi:SAM-dependent methyltransferase